MPFNPKYTITDKIFNNLTAIASAREVIEQACCLAPELEEKLRQQALLRNVHASMALAGNKLSFKQVKALCTKRHKKQGIRSVRRGKVT